jgi:hypothetical protein
MAYDAFGEYTGGQRDPYEEERLRQEEEDRKRREEAEQLARAAGVAGGYVPGGPGVAGGEGSGTYYDAEGRLIVPSPSSGPIAPDSDPLGSFIAQQLQGVKDRFGQAQTVFEDPARAFQERMDAATAPVKPDAVVKKEQVETRADGTKVVKTTQELPNAPPAQAFPVASPGGFQGQTDEFGGVDAAVAQQARQNAQTPAAVSTALPSTGVAAAPTAAADYNARIAQMESGGRDDIGYHDRSKSSAYGKYGITDKAWTDAQRANPALAGVRKEQATPAQMELAQNAVTNNNARYLGNLGVEVNPNTLAAAHFIGAQGLANYLKDGTISEGAIKANGGYDKAKQIIDQRLGGIPAAASGAAQQPPAPTAPVAPVAPTQAAAEAPVAAPEAVSPYSLSTGQPSIGLRAPGPTPAPVTSPASQAIDAYQANQNDPMALLKMRSDETVPAFIRERAGAQAYELLNRERKTALAQVQIEKLIANGDQNAIAKTLASKPKDEDGSIVKAVLYGMLGLKRLAEAEQEKLGAGTKWTSITGPDGENALVKVAANGRPLEGVKSDGTAMSDNELVKFGGGAVGGKVSTSAEQFQDKDGNIYRSQADEKGNLITKNIVTGKIYKGDPTKLTRVRDVASQAGDERKQAFKRENDATGFANSIRKLDYDSKLKAVAEFRQAAINRGEPDLTDTELSAMGVTRPDLGGARTQTAPAAAQPAAAPAQPQAAPGAGPVAPTPIAGQAPTAVAPVAPGAPVAPSVSGRMSVDEQNRIAAANKLQREGASAVNVDQQKRYNEYIEKDVQPKADAGKMISRVRKEQINGPEGILKNPEIVGMLQGGSGSEVGNILRDLITGAVGPADLSTRVGALNLNDRQKQVLYTQIGLNNQILPQTLKANAGPGAISEAEHKINREANVDIARQPLHSALSLMTRDQFVKDLSVARNDFRSGRNDIRTTDQLNKEWDAQERKAQQSYDQIYAARAAYIAKYNPLDKNGKQTNPGAVVDAFNHYPVPTWNGSGWDYGTEYAKKAARPPLSSFK